MAYPSTYRDNARVVISADTPNSSWIPVAPDEIPPAHHVLSGVSVIAQPVKKDIREHIQHADHNGDIPFPPLGPVARVIPVIGAIGNENREGVVGAAPCLGECLVLG